jgi:ribulose-phosphate 3-epimerase
MKFERADGKSVLVAPSILSADFSNLESECKNVESAGADWHHIDVMDGHFVPNLTIGPQVVKSIKKFSKLPLDVHIMVSNPDETFEQYLDAGADILTFHIEAAKHPHRIVDKIKSRGVKAGVSLNPGTNQTALDALLPYLDLVLVMSVNPGFGGQSFIQSSLDRIKYFYQARERLFGAAGFLIEIDGGINDQNAKVVRDSGVDAIVAGTAVYGAKNRMESIGSLKGAPKLR